MFRGRNYPTVQGLSVAQGSTEQRQPLRDVVRDRTRRFDFPVVMDMDFGHTAPQVTLPIGCRARIDSTTGTVEILEAAVT